MIEDHKHLVSRVATFQSALDALLGSIMAQDERTEARLTALETRPCSPASSASPAAAPGTIAYEPPAVCGECGRWSRSPWGERGIRFAQSWWCVAVFAVICAVFIYWVCS